MLFDVLEHHGGLELAVQDQRRAQEHPDGRVQKAQGVKHRRRQRRHLTGLERHVRQDAADWRQGGRGAAGGPFGYRWCRWSG
ncbi:AMP-dependent synthetase and ligase domain protein [Mycobacterium xenopi 3993]|nr:AMP-dependent synthetase and ligase domain protein [Mycobacterium xenopi 3993]